ncbi:MarR family transcriptional regulator [Streptomyces sp. HU2014]|uniref:MarR family transcriptional regulator n=1 Tax=Streptomyces albireticuli TaxID=1940 RepID=A0A1Z2KZA4_9ACTN|nr:MULTISPECIES: MarR family transcriptional regulator [Streptomyces]ARZ67281.1 MarR family transcriptional regulator [Streptomyces albireticuli]UQI47331.1 MarR family transcriptional regulator [Streptomyces sp. HU2014]
MNDRGSGLKAWRALLLAHSAAVRAIESDVQRNARIPLTWYDVLLELKGAGPDGLRMNELAERVVLSRTRVSRLVDEMARSGLVRKEQDTTDKRVVWALITDDGRAALRETAPVYLEGIERHFSTHLTDEEAEVIASALLKVSRGGRDELGFR